VGGKSEFGDKSSPEDIKKEFQVSKKVFKQAIGGLYKQGKIKITNEGIERV
jgi:predicted RNA-binding protein (virulence factor B family)